MRIGEVMTRKVERVGSSESPQRALTLLKLRRIHQLVVTDDHRIIGIVTQDALLSPAAAQAKSVDELMTRHVVFATPELPLRKAANLMRGSALGALPVLERGKLVGIVTVSDLLDLLGHGTVHVTRRGPRWTLRNRGVRPNRNPAARR